MKPVRVFQAALFGLLAVPVALAQPVRWPADASYPKVWGLSRADANIGLTMDEPAEP